MMNHRRRKLLAVLLSVVMVLAVFPLAAVTASAESGTAAIHPPPFLNTKSDIILPKALGVLSAGAENIIDMSVPDPPQNGVGWTFEGDVYTINDGANVTVIGINSDQRRIVVAENAYVNITLNDVSITELGNNQSPLLLREGANVTLTLVGVNTLSAGTDRAGIQTTGATLKIDGAGSLNASGGVSGAGIGGGYGMLDGAGGTVIINGGTVTATGGNDGGAGIGGSDGNPSGGAGGTVIINGGTVIATGNGGGAGIGGGSGTGGGGAGTLTMDGDGVVFASSVGDKSPKMGGILFDGNTGTVYGNSVTPTNSFTIPDGRTLTINKEQTLIIAKDITLTNLGTINNNGTITVNGTVTGDGDITNNGTINSDITYHLNGGTQQSGNWGKYVFNTAFVLPVAPTRADYTFGGWFDNVGLNGDAVTQIPAGDIGYREFWAKWVPVTHTVDDTDVGDGAGDSEPSPEDNSDTPDDQQAQTAAPPTGVGSSGMIGLFLLALGVVCVLGAVIWRGRCRRRGTW